jgi:hypothetical protein
MLRRAYSKFKLNLVSYFRGDVFLFNVIRVQIISEDKS